MNENRKYEKLMLISVGTGSTGKDIAHGIHFSIDDHNPNYVFLICSEESKFKTIPFILELLKEKNPNIIVELLENNEVNDIQKLHRMYCKYLQEIIAKGFSKENITIDYTSGTKSMSAALVSAALTTEVGKLSYVYGDRGDGGRVLSGTERMSSLSPSAIFTIKKINKSIELFNLYQFEGALSIIQSESFHPEFALKVKFLENLFNAFSAWDKFNFNSALRFIKGIDLNIAKDFKLKSKIEKDLNRLLALTKNDLSYIQIFDLLANAERRFEEGKYDDGIARLYRLLEMIAQVEFERSFGSKTDNVLLDKISEVHHAKLKRKHFDSFTNTYKIPLTMTYSILAEANNDVGLSFEQNKEEIKKLLGQRNQSILAHGSVPINKSSSEKILCFIKEKFIPSLNSSNKYQTEKFPKIQIIL